MNETEVKDHICALENQIERLGDEKYALEEKLGEARTELTLAEGTISGVAAGLGSGFKGTKLLLSQRSNAIKEVLEEIK